MQVKTLVASEDFFNLVLIPELGEIVKPELSHLLSELRNRSISEVLELFQ